VGWIENKDKDDIFKNSAAGAEDANGCGQGQVNMEGIGEEDGYSYAGLRVRTLSPSKHAHALGHLLYSSIYSILQARKIEQTVITVV
jgi:hypothetical protein